MDIGWRQYLKHFINFNGSVYEFGVYTGKSLLEILYIYDEIGLSIDRLYGLDSYEGLPYNETESQDCWTKGAFDSREHFKVHSKEEAIEKIKNLVNPYLKSCEFIPIIGFYDKLNSEDVTRYNLQPASYIDIDCDLYSSTYKALDFMFSNKLIKSGTIIGFDDWGGSPKWFMNQDGESKAWKEIREKYNIKADLMLQIGNEYPHVQRIYKVKSWS